MKRIGFVVLIATMMTIGAGRANAAAGWVYLNGSGFSYTPTLGATNQVLGRASIATGLIVNGELTGTSVTLSGTRSGLSNLKLWISTDNVFGGDSQFGSTVGADPGAGMMEFNGSTIQPASTTFYLFLTADVAGGASGSVIPTVSGMTSNASPFSFFPGPMADNAFLPVTVSLITAE